MRDKELIERLRRECETMRSRIKAILDCEEAIEELVQPEVFGSRYRDLLAADCRELSASIGLCNDALSEPEA